MGLVIVDVSPSVDGYVAGPGVSVAEPFGDAGLRLHRWLGFEATPTEADREQAERMFATAGAVVLGRRMFEVGIGTWGPDGAFGLPSFVVTRRPHEPVVKGPTTFTFVTTGVPGALDQAREAAGSKDVVVAGGADIIQQCLAAGLADELRLHVAPVLLGGGTSLFGGPPARRAELEQAGVLTTAHATHLTFQLAPSR
ncbi:MAG: dihydrofolate reductase family protein [Streptosporangiaceae bacterium]